MKKLQQDEYRRISELRAYLDAYAAKQAAIRIVGRPERCRQLTDALTRMQTALQACDYAEFKEADFALHATIISLAEVPFLHESWLPVWRGLQGLHSASFHECWPDLRVLIRAHAYLVEDICRGDACAAEQSARSHVQAVWHRYDMLHQNPDEADPLERAIAVIVFRLGMPIGLREIAEKTAFVSPGHLSRLFRQRYGVSFQKYVQNLRMEKAARLLHDTSLQVAEIARRVGYQDSSRFAQHFCRKFHIAPLQYRKTASRVSGRIKCS